MNGLLPSWLNMCSCRTDRQTDRTVRAPYVRPSVRQFAERLCDGHLERGPALAAVVALEALEELRVVAFVRVHVEAQVLLGEEARAADPAVVRSEKWLEGFIVAAERQERQHEKGKADSRSRVAVQKTTWYGRSQLLSLPVDVLLVLLSKEIPGRPSTLPMEELLLGRRVG